MRFITFRMLLRRIKAIRFMMKDKNVPKRKKLLVVLGLVYLFLPVDVIPPILGPVGFIDDLVLWLWILWNLKDTLDGYWTGETGRDLSKEFAGENVVEGVSYTVDGKDNTAEAPGKD